MSKRWIAVAALLALFVPGCDANEPRPVPESERGDAELPTESASQPAADRDPAIDGEALAATLERILEEAAHPGLRWPDFRDVRAPLLVFYEQRDHAPAWVAGGRPSVAARALIEAFENAASRGLRAEDYDGGRWDERLRRLAAAPETEGGLFDLAVTISAMRFLSALHHGRINPENLSYGISIAPKKLDLPPLVAELAASGDPAAVADRIEALEPPFSGRVHLERALARYRELAAEGEDEPLPVVDKLEPGDSYPALEALARRLRRLGDLPPTPPTPPTPDPASTPASSSARSPAGSAEDAAQPLAEAERYDGELVRAVERFQARHGLGPDGKIGKLTFAALNTPLSRRVEQIELTLERWRWAPSSFPRPPVVVNVPEFKLRAYGPDYEPELTMNVVVGTAFRHETRIFSDEIEYLVFRPTWSVPFSIQRSELVPKIAADPAYAAKNDYSVLDTAGRRVATIDAETIAGLRSGTLRLRQEPGPGNSLGLVKFIFPNAHNIYLHGTPAQSLFAKPRRDLSHGCIRVEKPAELAAWVLRDRPEWTAERIAAAMAASRSEQVNLEQPIPVLIVYGTAVATADGEVRFFDDLYGHDKTLAQALAAGYPYPE